MSGATVFEIGKSYAVPCIFVAQPNRQYWMPRNGWVPTLGPKHDDQALGLAADHFHIDWRFIDERGFDLADGLTPRLGRVITSASGRFKIDAPTVLKRRKCRRVMADFPSQSLPRWVAFEASHACVKLKPGNVCPHRGTDLTPFIKPDGTVVCPGHGLLWNTKTGDLMPRHAVAW